MSEKIFAITLSEPEKLEIRYKQKPVPGRGEVLIKIERVGVCGSDPTIYHGRHPYVSYPLVMGHEFSGTVEDLGAGTAGPDRGSRVTVIPHLVCGECEACKSGTYNYCEKLRCTGAEADGAYTRYICMPEEMVMQIPDTMSMDDAAMVEPACVAYHGARRGDLTGGDTVLVIGAGPIGIFCMQSCRALGAKRVIIADMDQSRLELALKLGADAAINVSETPLHEALLKSEGNPKAIDVFYDCVGEKGIVLNQILSIARRGTRIVVVGVLQNGFSIPLLPDFVQHELRLSGTTMYVPDDYRDMIDLMGRGIIKTEGMISHYFRLEDVQDVYDLIDAKKEKFFKIMLTLGDGEKN